MSSAPTRTLLFEVVSSRLLIAMYGENSPTDADWFKYIEGIASMGDEVWVLAFSSGGGPTLQQRRQLEDVLGERTGRAAIITPSGNARAIVAAIRWFNRDIKAFAPNDWEAALEFMHIEGLEARRVLRRLRIMAQQMGRVL
jgi:hypothetical protein